MQEPFNKILESIAEKTRKGEKLTEEEEYVGSRELWELLGIKKDFNWSNKKKNAKR